jgi:hypothetical protein
MGDRFAFRWLTALLMVAALAFVGVYTYNLGVAHGLATSGQAAGAVWPRPWGFGFGFFPFFPFLFILFFLFAGRGLCWRGGWRRRMYDEGGVPPMFEEWHRRAHAQPAPSRPPDGQP